MRRVAALSAVLALLVSAQVWGLESHIAARPLTPQEIVNFALPAETQIASGLFTVGVGSPVHLEALVVKVDGVAAPVASWSLGTKPSGSAAALASSPLGADVPTYTPGDRALFDVAGRQLLVPDKVGQYKVTATVGDTTLSATITAATYVGYQNCANCHKTSPPFTGSVDGPAVTWLETGHSDMLVRGLNGTLSDHYGANCISCHTVGYDTAPAAVNGGFDDVAKASGWVFPVTVDDQGVEHANLGPGTFEAMPAELQAVSNIQCENCHGPGSQHNGNVADHRISKTLNAGDCGQCHDSGSRHRKNSEWSASLHADFLDESDRAACAPCHAPRAFVQMTKGVPAEEWDLGYEAVTCAVCHDPHDATNEFQLRTMADVTLIDGTVVTEGGTGKLCMQCHQARRGGVEYASVYHSRHDPHHGPQTDMLMGVNAVDYGEKIRNSSHIYAVENSCAGCHMSVETDAASPEYLHAGGHTFELSWDGGTPDDMSDDVDLTQPCVACHGPMTSFDIPKDDYDGDGKVEGVQTEVEGLMEILAKALPPVGQNSIAISQEFTEKQLRATWNHNYVEEDKSHGIHNTQYAVGILKASIKDLTGKTISTGGGVRVLRGGVARGGLVASGMPAGKLVPGQYELYQNAPNPFNPETEIRYAVPEPVSVRIELYNSLGQKVRTLVEAHHAVGEYSATWNGRDADGQQVTAGMYIYTIAAGSFTGSGKMVLLP